MNKNIRVFAFPAVGIVLFLIIALFCTACSYTESYQETTMDFYAAHRTELQAAQATLQDFAEANDDSMLIRPVEALGKDYQNEGVCVKRVNELYFISRKGEYAAEVYQSIYESVLPLFRAGFPACRIWASNTILRCGSTRAWSGGVADLDGW